MECAGLRRVAAAVLVGGGALCVSVSGTVANEIDTVSNLEGNWSGSGRISLNNGEQQNVKCRANSNVSGMQANQSLRCASASSQIAVNVSFALDDDKVNGTWSEGRSGAQGSLSGDVNGKSIMLRLRGGEFNGTMHLTAARCSQNVAINASGKDLRSANIQLRKC